MTPAEAWQAMLDPADQMKLDEASLRHLFMPAKLCTATRANQAAALCAQPEVQLGHLLRFGD